MWTRFKNWLIASYTRSPIHTPIHNPTDDNFGRPTVDDDKFLPWK